VRTPGLAIALVLLAAPVSANDLVGAEVCGTCHVEQYKQWRSSGHAVALARLTKAQQRDRVCRSCHSSAPDSQDAALAGVQCESCHGPGRFYAPRAVMLDPELRVLLGLAKIDKNTCASCHRGDGPALEPFDFDRAIELVKHGTKKR